MRSSSVLALASLIQASLMLACFAGPAVASDPPAPASKNFDGWTGTCNNLGTCVALATAESDTFFYVRIARDAGAATAPEVKLVLISQEAMKAPSPAFALNAEAKGKTTALGPFPATTDATDKTQFTAILPAGTSGLTFIDTVRDADTLDYALLGARGSLDLKGLSATLRWIDAHQGRAGTPTALVARGMTPIGQVPEPVEPPAIFAAPAGSVAEIVKPILSKAVLVQAASLPDCEKEIVAAHETAAAWRLNAGTNLVAVPCAPGAYNFTVALYFTDENGAAVRAVPLPPAPIADKDASPNVLTNIEFDPATMVLSEFAKSRGIGDCGEARQWIWTGKAFVLLEASRLDACPGALQEDWPVLYSARRGGKI